MITLDTFVKLLPALFTLLVIELVVSISFLVKYRSHDNKSVVRAARWMFGLVIVGVIIFVPIMILAYIYHIFES